MDAISKKIVLGIISFSIAVGALCSCSSNSTQNEKEFSTQSIDIGLYHNRCLEHIYSDTITITQLSFNQLLNYFSKYLEEEIYGEHNLDDTKRQINTLNSTNSFGNNFSFIIKDSLSIQSKTTLIINYLSSNLNTSTTFNNALSNFLIDNYNSNNSSNDIITSYYRHFTNIPMSEITLSTTFINVLSSSSRFWTTNSLSSDSKVIINDAIGALLGIPLGTAGSIILSAIISVGTQEEINNQNNNNHQ